MELAATVIPLLFIALVFEQRLGIGRLTTGASRRLRQVDAVLGLATAAVLLVGEAVALISVQRDFATDADERFVLATMGLGGLLLMVPLIIERGLEATDADQPLLSRVKQVAVTAFVALLIAMLTITYVLA
jgi:uncharacterized membrane protein